MAELRYSEFRSCVKVEVAFLGSPSLISLMVSVDVKHHAKEEAATRKDRTGDRQPVVVSRFGPAVRR